MSTRKTLSVSNVDLGGAAAALLIAAVGVVLWVRPAIVDRQTQDACRSEYLVVACDLADTEGRCESVRIQADATREALVISCCSPSWTFVRAASYFLIRRLTGNSFGANSDRYKRQFGQVCPPSLTR